VGRQAADWPRGSAEPAEVDADEHHGFHEAVIVAEVRWFFRI